MTRTGVRTGGAARAGRRYASLTTTNTPTDVTTVTTMTAALREESSFGL
ncbi:hypothetical protein ACFZAG_02435 [Streptomyces sp. NPDC012403]|nr:hypothetical protein [Streptomyces sp. AC558_RSS880]